MFVRGYFAPAIGPARRQGDRRARTQRAGAILTWLGGTDEDEYLLHDKAEWYLDAGVEVVWIVLPDSREVVAVTAAGAQRVAAGQTLPAHSSLPGLCPRADELFVQINEA